MTRANPALVTALFETATRLERGANYRWTHMGACNCGHLAQTLTALTPKEIHERALQRAGDWSEQVLDVCPTTRLPIDDVIDAMLDAGLTRHDIRDLERLSGQAVLQSMPPSERMLDRRRREHVVRYLRAWAALLTAGKGTGASDTPSARDVAQAGQVRGRIDRRMAEPQSV